jgi:hypothetical protein
LKISVFYSWQSDIKAAANRSFIQEALEAAVKEIRADDSIAIEPVIDRDTAGVPGAPDIGSTIFEKIDASTIFVADVTIVSYKFAERPTPNPNVLIELGYALKSLGGKRVMLVQNNAFGGPHLLPFDLRQKRVLGYNSPEDAENRSDERRKLRAALKEAILLIMQEIETKPISQYPVELLISYINKKITADRHDYTLRMVLENNGDKVIKEWHVDVIIPTQLLDPLTKYMLKIESKSDNKLSFFRSTQNTHSAEIYPGDKKIVMDIDYRVDNPLFFKRGNLFNERVIATAYIHGAKAAVTERIVEELQCF